jgi:hypothetical protein
MTILNKHSINVRLLAALLVLASSCERKLSDEAVLPSFATTAEVFTDNFIGLGADFYFPFADAKPDVFSVDITEGYQSNASIRIDVPNATDPSGSYAGAIFRAQGAGRNLTGYTALTFYVKASTGVKLGDVGFGINYNGDQYRVTTSNVNVSTNWSKVVVPIPDPSKLLNERGLFWFAAGTQGTNGSGYTLWFDEIKFENSGLVGHPTANILNGEIITEDAFIGSTVELTGLNQVYNLTNGQDITTTAATSYYHFMSSDTTVATVNDAGVVNILAIGTAEITANLAGKPATGKLIVKTQGDLPASPAPTHPQSNVKSIFSDVYTNATESNFDPKFGGSTAKTSILNTSSGKVLQYADNNYTGIIFDNSLDCSTLGFLHVDVYVKNPTASIEIQIRDIGANKSIETNVFTGFPEGDDKEYRFNLTGLQTGIWKSFEIPLTGGIANQKNNLGAIIIVNGPNFILDNIYFYKQ